MKFRKNLIAYRQIFIILLYILLCIKYLFLLNNLADKPVLGDEGFYQIEFQYLEEHGIYALLAKGASGGFLLSSWAISAIVGVEEIFAARILSFISLILTIVIWTIIGKKYLKIQNYFQHLIIITIMLFAVRVKCFFSAISDPLMIFVISLSLLYIFKYFHKRKNKYLLISAVFIGLTFWIRGFSLIFFISILAAFCLAEGVKNIFFNKKNLNTFSLYLLTVIITALIYQVPSLIKFQSIRFEDKTFGGLYKWTERNYLGEIKKYDSGSIFVYQKVPWSEVEEYLEENGYDSLPHSTLEGLVWDLPLTIKKFFFNLLVRLNYLYSVNTGFFYFAFILLIVFALVKKQKYRKEIVFLASLVFFFSLLISLIIIRLIEVRWVVLPVITIIFVGSYALNKFSELRKYHKIAKIIADGQSLLLLLLILLEFNFF